MTIATLLGDLALVIAVVMYLLVATKEARAKAVFTVTIYDVIALAVIAVALFVSRWPPFRP
jgi:hypothetical protein